MTESNEIKHSIGLSSDSKEKWTRHAITKLSKGFKLYVHKTRKVANFNKGHGDLETCPHHSALRLIKEGYLVQVGEDDDRTIYELKPEFNEQNLPKKKLVKQVTLKIVDDDDDDDDLDDDDLDVDDLAGELDDDLEDELDEELEEDEIKISNDDDDDLTDILEDED